MTAQAAAPERHIVAMGGGGFSMEPENRLLDDFVLSLTGAEGPPRVCFLATASGDSDNYIRRFHDAFPPARAQASHLALFRRDGTDVGAFLRGQDVVYVGGGSTANLLALWRLHGVDAAVREALANGTVLCGVSAGMLCWFEGSVTDSFGPLAALDDGIGVISGSACPHYDGDPGRRPLYQRLVANGTLPAGVAADDGAALHYVDGQLAEAVASRARARAYRVTPGGEEPIPTRYLG